MIRRAVLLAAVTGAAFAAVPSAHAWPPVCKEIGDERVVRVSDCSPKLVVLGEQVCLPVEPDFCP